METYSITEMSVPTFTPYKRIVKYNYQFNPKTKQTDLHRCAIDALDVRQKEHFTQKTFIELITEHEEECSPYIIARIKTSIAKDNKFGSRYDYYDAHALLIYLFGNNFLETYEHRYATEMETIKKNPMNHKPISALEFYQINNLNDFEFKYIGSDCELYYYQATENISENLNKIFVYERERQEFINEPLILKAEKLININLLKAVQIFHKIVDQNLQDALRAKYNLAILNYGSENEEIKKAALEQIIDISKCKEEDSMIAEAALNFLLSTILSSDDTSIFSDEK